VPGFIQQAEANLQDSPEVWNKVAREENDGNVGLIDTTLRADCPPDARMRFDQAATAAIASLQGFNHWLENNLSEKKSDWRLGKERYARSSATLVDRQDARGVARGSGSGSRQVRAEIAKLAAPQSVDERWRLSRASMRRGHVHAVREAGTGDATAFVKAKDLLTLPANGNLEVIETPVFMRGFTASALQSGAALEPKLGAFFWVTPIPGDWAHRASTRNCANTMHRRAASHRARGDAGALCASRVCQRGAAALAAAAAQYFRQRPVHRGLGGVFTAVDGGAGLLGDTPGYRLTLQKQLLRVLANTILDVRLQTLGMTDQQRSIS